MSVPRLLSLIREQTGLDQLPFRPGCSPSCLRELEESLRLSLPEDYRELLRCFNGQEHQPELTFPPDGLMFLSDAEVLGLWREFDQYRDDERFADELRDADRVRSVLYHRGRIPIAYNESGGCYLCLDRIPGPAGHLDQLVVNVDEIDCVALEDSVATWIERLVWLMETGRAAVREQPHEYGEGYWFEAGGQYLDHQLYRELTASS